jgi:hypothetical protein
MLAVRFTYTPEIVLNSDFWGSSRVTCRPQPGWTLNSSHRRYLYIRFVSDQAI